LDLNPARATNPPGQNYLITPDQIRQAVETGSITLTFHWGETFELGGRHDNQLTVTIEVEKQAPGEKSPGVLSVSPADDFQSSGPDAKGRFNPEKKTYTLANTGQGPLQFQAAPDHPWVTVSAPSGSIPPKGNRSVVIGIDAAKAQALPAGPKECPVQFKNLTNGQGTTNRKVKIGRWEKWRALWHGWETLYFGDETLAGGIKPIWEIQVDFEIEDGKYKQGQGTAKFVAFEPHSHPPGVYDCNPKKGEIIDGKGKKQPTPFIQHTQFNVSGSANSASAKLNLPSENLYLVDYECFMDTDQAKDKLGLKFGKLAAKDKVKESDNYKSIKNNGQPLPSGSQTVMLQDGWKKEFGETKSMDAYWILVRRLE
jgi:hypothetical protein